MKSRLLTLLLSTLAVSCGPSVLSTQEEEVPGYLEARLSLETKRARCDTIKNHASLRGLTNPVLVAGVANHETGLVQCWSENTIHCQGPASSDCGGGPVLAGSGDGPCSHQQGGLGMFQFDSGTYSQTLASYGSDILTVTGNSRQGVDTVIYKARVCRQFANDEDTIAWMNTATPGTQAYEDFLTAMASCYNGCTPSLSCHTQRRLDYDAGIKNLLSDFGNDYWYNQDALRSAPQRVARDAEGRITLVARSANGTAYFNRQSSAGSSTWAGWTSLGGTLVQEPVIARNSNGRLTAFGVGTDNALYINHQSSSSAWTGWIHVGGSFASHVAVSMNQDGRLEVFGRGTDQALWRTNQTSAGGTSWPTPYNMGGVLTSDPAVALDKNGYLNVFLVGTEGRFFR
ncbi:MAG TPA: hypothetical protein VLQ93_13395, partial [Myxococcaceae bacterium]|nr:hypothetical protein [Myxococcaceae bacterium]